MFKLSIIFWLSSFLFSTDSVWVNCYKGKVFYRYAKSSEWRLIVNKERVNLESDILSEKGALFVINKNLQSYDFDNEHFFFLKYLFVDKKEDLLLELTKLDASVIRSPYEKLKKRKIGKTYGYTRKKVNNSHIKYRERTIMHFLYMGYLNAALLEEKRLLMLDPVIFEKRFHLDNIITLYKKIGLKGFLLDDLKYLSLRLSDKKTKKIILENLNQLNSN